MTTQFEVDDRSVVEFQLGNKQLLLLFLGLLVICAIFFFIGLRVGEDTARSKAAIVLDDDLSAAGVKKASVESEKEATGVPALAMPTKTSEQTGQSSKTTSNTTSPVKDAKVQESRPAAPESTTTRETRTTQQSLEDSAAQSTSGYFVQVAAPTDDSGAKKLKDSLASQQLPAVIQQATVNGRVYYRVRVGPFSSKAKAEEVRQSLLSRFPKAFLAKS